MDGLVKVEELEQISYATELKLFKRWLVRNPLRLYFVFKFLLKKLLFRLKKNKIHSLIFYPPKLLLFLPPEIQSISWPYGNTLNSEGELDKIELNFAGLKCTYEKNQNIDFLLEHEDSEVREAIHRFAWLDDINLHSSKAQKSWALLQIIRWNQTFVGELRGNGRISHARWEPYTISERLVHILKFIARFEIHLELTDQESLFKQLHYLVYHLEIQDPFTGNHIINNTRALYLAGTLLKQEQYIRFSTWIILRYLPRFIGRDKLLNEGSSHYAFLFYSWIQDLLSCAQQNKHEELIQFLSPIRDQMEKSLKLWLGKNLSYPLFGDISPDISPQLLQGRLGLQGSAENKTEGDLCRIQLGEFTLYYRQSIKDQFQHVGHFHQDLLQVIIYYKGSPINCDAGRVTYHDQASSSLRAWSHNSVMVNNLELLPYPFLHYPKEYCEATIEVTHSPNSLLLKTTAFARHLGEVIFERRVVIEKNKVTITDLAQGKAVNSLYSFYLFNPVKNNEKIKIQLTHNGQNTQSYTFDHASAYGEAEPSQGLAISSFNQGKIEHSLTVEVQDVRD